MRDIMNRRILEATGRPKRLIGRKADLSQLKTVFHDNDKRCKLVLLEGSGGLGKTRLLEEVLRRVNHPSLKQLYPQLSSGEMWDTNLLKVCQIIDFVDIKLHTVNYLLDALGDSYSWSGEIGFTNFKRARDRRIRLQEMGATYESLQLASEEADLTFWEELREATEKYRLVIPLDTVERLANISSEWMIENNLLTTEDLVYSTQHWLINHIIKGDLQNTVLLIAGRGKEGQPFFDQLKESLSDHEDKCQILSIKANKLTIEETKQFYEVLLNDWQSSNNSSSNENLKNNFISLLSTLLNDENKLNVLHKYTEGQPVLLSLYTDILLEGRQIPKALLSDFSKVEKQSKKELESVRREIEAEFVDLLYRSSGDLRAQIMRLLVQATRGLNPDQIHFILDRPSNQPRSKWIAKKDRVQEISEELNHLSHLALVKYKDGGRIWLQDEVYRIYAEHMAKDPIDREDETNARFKLYNALLDYAEYARQPLLEARHKYIRQDLLKIRVERPSKILGTRLPSITSGEERRRTKIIQDILEWDLEIVHYGFLTDPDKHFNDPYYNMESTVGNSHDEISFSTQQSAFAQILKDELAFKFIKQDVRPEVLQRGETRLAVLKRATYQYNAAQWIFRLINRNKYTKAIDLANRIEDVVDNLPEGLDKLSWQNPFAKGNRQVWKENAEIYLGNIREAIPNLDKIIDDFRQLIASDEPVVAGYVGFKEHPARMRLILSLANAYNLRGYGYTQLGSYNQANADYAQSLRWLKELPPTALQSTVRNNLARSLSEQGKKRAVRVCIDSLDLRIQLGQLLPIGYSLNTLSLIHNYLNSPGEALEASARAYAIANKVRDTRFSGLVLIQITKSLRRVISSGFVEAASDIRNMNRREAISGFTLTKEIVDSPEDIFQEAEYAISEAIDIFSKGTASGESIRLVEALNEAGGLYRDWLLLTDDDDSAEQLYRDALDYYQQGLEIALKNGWDRLILEIMINIAWAHFYFNDEEAINDILEQIDEAMLKICSEVIFIEGQLPPDPMAHESYLFLLQAKISNLRGRVAFEKFNLGTSHIADVYSFKTHAERQQIVHNDEKLQSYLKAAAEHYAKGLGYAKSFAPRSAAVTFVLGPLYNFLKKLNAQEMSDFYLYKREAHSKYLLDEISLKDVSDLEEFLIDCFGNYFVEL